MNEGTVLRRTPSGNTKRTHQGTCGTILPLRSTEKLVNTVARSKQGMSKDVNYGSKGVIEDPTGRELGRNPGDIIFIQRKRNSQKMGSKEQHHVGGRQPMVTVEFRTTSTAFSRRKRAWRLSRNKKQITATVEQYAAQQSANECCTGQEQTLTSK